MLLLEELNLQKNDGLPSILDVSPIINCQNLWILYLSNNRGISDLSFLVKGFTKLQVCYINFIGSQSAVDLNPLIKLRNLEHINCHGISADTSLLPLARCLKLKSLACSRDAKDLHRVRERRPKLFIKGRDIILYSNI